MKYILLFIPVFGSITGILKVFPFSEYFFLVVLAKVVDN